jgi:fructokinase
VKIVSAGEILWDIFPGAERLGGAAFNFAVNTHRLGHEVLLVSAVGEDDRGRRALEQMRRIGLSTDFVRIAPRATGVATVALEAGEPRFTIHRPAAYDLLEFDPRLIDFRPDWIYFGTLLSMEERAGRVLQQILTHIPGRCLYDANLRPDSFTRELAIRLAQRADAIKLTESELAELGWRIEEIPARFKCVTRGERGCTVISGDDRADCGGYRVPVADTVGAGDAFAAAFLHGIDKGWPAAEVGDFANRLAALVVSRPGAIPEWTITELEKRPRPV